MRISRRDLKWCGTVLLTLFVCGSAAMGVLHDAGAQAAAREVVLTQSAPRAVFPLDEQHVSKGQTTVVVRLVRQENPDHVDFFVALTLAGCHGGDEKQTAPVGSLGVYPAGQTEGSYAFDIGPALKEMRGMPTEHVCMKLELKPMRPSADWKRLHVTVSSPEWKHPPGR